MAKTQEALTETERFWLWLLTADESDESAMLELSKMSFAQREWIRLDRQQYQMILRDCEELANLPSPDELKRQVEAAEREQTAARAALEAAEQRVRSAEHDVQRARQLRELPAKKAEQVKGKFAGGDARHLMLIATAEARRRAGILID